MTRSQQDLMSSNIISQLFGNQLNQATTAQGINSSNVRDQLDAGNSDLNNQISAHTTNVGVEAAYRTMLMNQLQSLSGNPMLQFATGNTNAGVLGQTPIADSIYNSYQGNLNKYNTDIGSGNNTMSGLANIGAGFFSGGGTLSGIGKGLTSLLAM